MTPEPPRQDPPPLPVDAEGWGSQNRFSVGRDREDMAVIESFWSWNFRLFQHSRGVICFSPVASRDLQEAACF